MIQRNKSGKINVFLFHFFLPSSVVLILISYLVCSHLFIKAKELDERLEKETVSLFEHVITDELGAVSRDLEILANSSHIRSFVNGNESNKQDLKDDFMLFSSVRGIYDQIRYLDSSGMEIIRVNAMKGGAIAVPEKELQNKKNRYYFEDSYEISRGETYISPLDLNIEHSEIEIPFKPMIRFGTPVFDSQGVKKGVVLLNYLAKSLLNEIKKTDVNYIGKKIIVNSDGYFLKGLKPEDEWGFMFPQREKKTMGEFYKEAWNTINRTNSGQISYNGYLFTFSTLYPVSDSFRSSSGSGSAYNPSKYKIKGSDYYWKIISVVEPSYFEMKRNNLYLNMLWVLGPALLILCVASWILANYRIRRIMAENALHKVNESLESTVQERTSALNRANADLIETIEELKRSKDVIEEGERYYRSLINSIQEEIMVVAKDYKVTDINDTFVKATGFSRDQIIGKNCYETYHNLDSPCMFDGEPCPIERVITTGQSERLIHKHLNAKGENRWVEIIFSPLLGQAGKIAGVIKVTRDIHEERVLEEQLRQAQKMEAIGRLSGGIAHDFNNILSPIMGYTEISLEMIQPDQDELKENLAEIMKAAKRARDLIKQILAFSYQSDNELKPILIHIVVKEALGLLKAMIPSTIEIRTDIDSRCGSVLADATQIHQIVMNLCTNAYHAMEGEPGYIEVSLGAIYFAEERIVASDQLKGDYVLLRVFNTGKGIDKENMDRIFEPFFTTKEKGKGTGLGLAMVYSIVKAYGGTITVKSEETDGTTFDIYFPRLGDEVETKDDQGADLSPVKAKGEHIMVVDDDSSILDLEKKVLRNLGYRITVFSESKEALSAFREAPEDYDMIITDYTMPSMSGETLAREVISIRKDLPIVLITGFSGKFNFENAKKIGIKAFLTKPLIISHLVQVIRQVLDESRES